MHKFVTTKTNLMFLFGVTSQKVSYFLIVNLQVRGPHKEFCVFSALSCTQIVSTVTLPKQTQLRQVWTITITKCARYMPNAPVCCFRKD